MAVKVKRKSRLLFTDLLVIDGITFWDTVVYPDIPEKPDDIQYTVTATDRIDLLAFDYYGDPALWYVIAIANGMNILPTDLNEGDVIRIPSPTFIQNSYVRK